MPEQDEEREFVHREPWSDDERAITLSELLGETPEEASRRTVPPPASLNGSPRGSLLFVGFSAVVVACLVAIGALVTHSGQFADVGPDQRLSGLSGTSAAPEPPDLAPVRPNPGLATGPGGVSGPGPDRRPGGPGPRGGPDAGGGGTGRQSPGGAAGSRAPRSATSGTGSPGATSPGATSPGAARGASDSDRTPAGTGPRDAGDTGQPLSYGRSGSERGGDNDRHGSGHAGRGGHSERPSWAGSPDSGTGGALPETVNRVVDALTASGASGALDLG